MIKPLFLRSSFMDARQIDPDAVLMDLPLSIVRQLEQIVSASIRSDPVIRNVDDETVSRLTDIFKAKKEEGPLLITRQDFDALSRILTAVATEDLGDVGVQEADIENLERQVWKIRNDLSGPKVA